MTAETEKKKMSSPLRCGHCSNIGSMEIRCSDVITTQVDTEFPGQPSAYDCTEVLRCLVCHKLTLRTYFYHDLMDDDSDVTYVTLYPGNSGIPDGLPEHVEKEFAIGQRVKDISGNLFGIQMRRILELVCADRLGPKAKADDDLADHLKALATQGDIPQKVADVAHHGRIFGNIGAHPMMESGIEPEHVPVVEKLCKAVLEYVYSMPKLVADAGTMLDGLKKKRKPKKP